MKPALIIAAGLLGLAGCSTTPVAEKQANQDYIQLADSWSELQEHGGTPQTDRQTLAAKEALRLFPDIAARWAAWGKDDIKHKVVLPRVVQVQRPAYPPGSLYLGHSGVVYLAFRLGSDGIPRDIQALFNPEKRLATAAQKAVEGWRFTPASVDGTPTEIATAVPIQFEL